MIQEASHIVVVTTSGAQSSHATGVAEQTCSSNP
jgi:hypothetical protein